jgi:hypothetical protein
MARYWFPAKRYGWGWDRPPPALTIVHSDDDVSSHMLVGGGAKVHVIAAGESWPLKEVKSVLREG